MKNNNAAAPLSGGKLEAVRRIPATLAVIVAVLFSAGSAWADFDDGVAAYDSGDNETAFREFLPLAEQGIAKAQYNLGIMYDIGEGVPKNDAEAVKWYRMAAEQGDAKAQDSMVLVSLKNVASSDAVRCIVHLAHWFAHDLGRLEWGQRVAFVVHVQPGTKLVMMKNDAGVDMAVEGIHCAVVASPRRLVHWISADALRDKRGQVEFVCGSGVVFRCHTVAIKP